MEECKTLCPLCLNEPSQLVPGPDQREYRLCHHCHLISVAPRFLLTISSEKERYEKHHNGLESPGHVAFLNRAIEQSIDLLQSNMKGLDYGCGPVPVLSSLLQERGIPCENYDPLYFPKQLSPGYDFIFSTECFEHFFSPASELKKLHHLLKENGLLIIMTEKWKDVEAFRNWYYARDSTHVAFYHEQTFGYISKTFHFTRLPVTNERVIILRKNGDTEVKAEAGNVY